MTIRTARRVAVGSPAWAGIDPQEGDVRLITYRFPRVGGDRPPIEVSEEFIQGVPPRGRG